jgi:CO/xanthine dehydrogenase FAD-binding subunit
MMTRGERSPSVVVDLRRLGLDGVRDDGDEVVIGARTTYATILSSEIVRERIPLLGRMAAGITGGAQVRNLGTVGGSACHAAPSSDVPACLVALGARMRLQGPAGRRDVAAADFFAGPFETVVEPAEILVDIAVKTHAQAFGYHKLKLCESSWPIATAAAIVGENGATVTLGAVAGVPFSVALDDMGGRTDAELDALVEEQLVEPWEDVLAPARYRRAVAGPVARRALREAIEGSPDA